MNFASDNVMGASPDVLEAILRANSGPLPGYGADPDGRRAENCLNEIFETECVAFFVATGTAANALALGAVTPPYGAVFCHTDSHIAEEECGAPEFFTGGAKLATIVGAAAKLTPDALAAELARFPRGIPRQVQPASLSLSQATEAGTIYTVSEIKALTAIAASDGIKVHMDGARFANALVALGCTAAEMSWKAGVDVLSFGASKNGLLAGEAVIFFKPEMARDFAYQIKRSGHLLSKSRLFGAQFAAYLADGHWLDLAANANRQAKAMSEGLAEIPGVRLVWPVQANEIFVIFPDRVDAALKAAGGHYYPWAARSLPCAEGPGHNEKFVRLITSFATRAEEVEKFVAVAASA